jgi:hypothetical protein
MRSKALEVASPAVAGFVSHDLVKHEGFVILAE